MIALRRTPEPGWLPATRATEVARVEQALAGDPRAVPPAPAQPLTSDLVAEAYRPAATDLWRMQDRKCCYCEAMVQLKFNDVEHYRPKAEAQQQRSSRSSSPRGPGR